MDTITEIMHKHMSVKRLEKEYCVEHSTIYSWTEEYIAGGKAGLQSKEELYLNFDLGGAENASKRLDKYVHYFNYERPASALGSKSPVQYKTEPGF